MFDFFEGFWYGITHPFSPNPMGALTQEEIEELIRRGELKPSLFQKVGDMWDDTMGNIIKFFPLIVALLILFGLWKLGAVAAISKVVKK